MRGLFTTILALLPWVARDIDIDSEDDD